MDGHERNLCPLVMDGGKYLSIEIKNKSIFDIYIICEFNDPRNSFCRVKLMINKKIRTIENNLDKTQDI